MAILYLYRIVTFKAVLLKFADAVASTELVIHFVSTYIYAAVRVLYNVSFRIPSALCVFVPFLAAVHYSSEIFETDFVLHRY